MSPIPGKPEIHEFAGGHFVPVPTGDPRNAGPDLEDLAQIVTTGNCLKDKAHVRVVCALFGT